MGDGSCFQVAAETEVQLGARRLPARCHDRAGRAPRERPAPRVRRHRGEWLVDAGVKFVDGLELSVFGRLESGPDLGRLRLLARTVGPGWRWVRPCSPPAAARRARAQWCAAGARLAGDDSTTRPRHFGLRRHPGRRAHVLSAAPTAIDVVETSARHERPLRPPAPSARALDTRRRCRCTHRRSRGESAWRRRHEPAVGVVRRHPQRCSRHCSSPPGSSPSRPGGTS